MAATDAPAWQLARSVHLTHLTLGLQLQVKPDTSSKVATFAKTRILHISTSSHHITVCAGAARKAEKESFLVFHRRKLSTQRKRRSKNRKAVQRCQWSHIPWQPLLTFLPSLVSSSALRLPNVSKNCIMFPPRCPNGQAAILSFKSEHTHSFPKQPTVISSSSGFSSDHNPILVSIIWGLLATTTKQHIKWQNALGAKRKGKLSQIYKWHNQKRS